MGPLVNEIRKTEDITSWAGGGTGGLDWRGIRCQEPMTSCHVSHEPQKLITNQLNRTLHMEWQPKWSSILHGYFQKQVKVITNHKESIQNHSTWPNISFASVVLFALKQNETLSTHCFRSGQNPKAWTAWKTFQNFAPLISTTEFWGKGGFNWILLDLDLIRARRYIISRRRQGTAGNIQGTFCIWKQRRNSVRQHNSCIWFISFNC